MRSLTQALLYPGVGILETTNLSVGRGTDTPFEWIGAPWMDAAAMARRIRAQGLPGLSCYPVRFTPESSKHSGKLCSGLRFEISDRQRFRPLMLGLALARALVDLHPEDWKHERYPRLLGKRGLYDALLAGASLPKLLKLAGSGMVDFSERRARYLIYR